VFAWLDYHYAYSLGNYQKLDETGDLNWENITKCNRFSANLVVTVMQTIQALDGGSKLVGDLLQKNWATMRQMNERRKEMWKASRWQRYDDTN
jgi:hypothetical protein